MNFEPTSAAREPSIFGVSSRPADARVVLLPVPWEATGSKRSSAARAPAAILEASQRIEVFDRETGRPHEAGIAALDLLPELREWNDRARAAALQLIADPAAGSDPHRRAAVAEVDELGLRLNAWVYEESRRWLEQGKLVGVVGGDHSVPFGAIRALAESHPGLGILHFGAHPHLRYAYQGFRWSHASIMNNVLREVPGVFRLVQAGVRDCSVEEDELIRDNPNRIRTYFDVDLRQWLFDGETWRRIAGRVVAELPREVYVSFDIAALDPSLCPNTGTPVVGGLSFAEATALLQVLVESGRHIIGFDLCEVAPDPRGSDWDGSVGARVLYKLIGFGLLSQKGH
jgi:agmatinase